jgi:hypothetical protein
VGEGCYRYALEVGGGMGGWGDRSTIESFPTRYSQ